MTGPQFNRWQELREIVKTSDSMSQIYAACKEMVALQEGYKVIIVPLNPTDCIGKHAIYNKSEEVAERKEMLAELDKIITKL